MTAAIRLRDVGTTYGGLTGKTKEDFGNGNAQFVTFLEVINSIRLRGRSLERVRSAQGERQCRVIRGDLLFNGSSETPEEVALSAVVDFDPDDPTFLNSFCFGYRLRPDAEVDPTYLAYFFRSPAGRSVVSPLAQGATRYNIAKTKFLEIELALPSLKRQGEIVDSLNGIEGLIASLECLITKKQAIKQGMMQELLTGRTRLPGFTRNWVPGTFEELASPVKDRTFPAQVSPDTPLVELDQIESATGRLLARSTVTSATSLKTRFQVGDVLFGKLRAYLRKFWIADTNGLCTTEIWAFRSKPGVSAKFVRFIVETDGFIEVASGAYGTHMPRSDWGTVRRYEISIPEPEEQTAIASVLMDADREIEVLRTRLAKARDIKQGMMQELLTGRTRLPVREAVA